MYNIFCTNGDFEFLYANIIKLSKKIEQKNGNLTIEA
ncbi:hypothetical protein J2Z66_004541 [Paenibacillus eucommiae]|uniref:Uncharacterized protein n=1 Tax=Paenibacillus eucommiae TaxID=1355755 RepID=A0ABS4J284_9BACL|nr:hypothetical protein [Paenibacillus eucommiae]